MTRLGVPLGLRALLQAVTSHWEQGVQGLRRGGPQCAAQAPWMRLAPWAPQGSEAWAAWGQACCCHRPRLRLPVPPSAGVACLHLFR